MTIRFLTHFHSTYSYDGTVSLADIRQIALDAGIQCICMTEHVEGLNVETAQQYIDECAQLSDEHFLFIPGFEVPYRYDDNEAHILLLGASRFVEGYYTEEALRAWRAVASAAVLAHPHRNKFVVDAVVEDVIDAAEVWNSQYDSRYGPRGESITLYESLREKGVVHTSTAGIDFHMHEHFGGAWMEVEVDTLSATAVLSALVEGKAHIVRGAIRLPAVDPAAGVSVWHRVHSACVRVCIGCCKRVYSKLRRCGFSVPKWLLRFIRGVV